MAHSGVVNNGRREMSDVYFVYTLLLFCRSDIFVSLPLLCVILMQQLWLQKATDVRL